MNHQLTLTVIGHLHGAFSTKFGLPRQSGLAEDVRSIIIFTPEFRVKEALRGMEGYSHLWLLWGFSENKPREWTPTVRPPRLGGNKRMGVFATRSPYRPNPIGLSCVALESIDYDAEEGPILHVRGADMMDGTPIYDIKPYLPFADSYPQAKGGFADEKTGDRVRVVCEERLLDPLPCDAREALLQVLAGDPRPAYQDDPARVYGFSYAGCEVKFTVNEGVLTVQEIL